ncbi:replication initiation protein [Kocuria sp. M1R5S2]|uniref:replication initiation protein n=1 Tax=Kocuria rhizosphaerae TaxID=3376285 RepID=UPI0037B11BA3
MSPSVTEPCPQGHPALLSRVEFQPDTVPEAPASPAERFLAHHRVRYFRCGQTKHQAFPNRGRRAAEFAFIQLNPAEWLNFLVVDVDREDALMCLMHPAVPEPTWIIENEETGHAQAGWAIESVYLGEGARPGPIRYAGAVQQALDRLVDGDPCFTRHLVRNPAATRPAGRVWWGNRTVPWSLGDLKAHLCEWVDPFHEEALDGPAESAWNPGPALPGQAGIPRAGVVDTATEVGRNNAVFRATRRWLWDQWETHRQAPTDAASIAHARGLNAQLPSPLPEAELTCLARSAARQVNAGKGRPTRTSGSDAAGEYLSRMGRRGGKARTEAKVAAAKDNVAQARAARTSRVERLRARAVQLRAAGATYAVIAAAVGRTARTIMAWLKGTPTAPENTDADRGEIVQATGISPASPVPADISIPPGAAPVTPEEGPSPVPPQLTYRWPAGTSPDDPLPDLADPLPAEDRRLVLWVPLDFLDDAAPGSGYWCLTTASSYRDALGEGIVCGDRIGDQDLHAGEVGARIGQLLGSGLPRLSAASHEVVRTQGQSRWSARFPAYIVH